jgi:predicted Zn-dependent peptidase
VATAPGAVFEQLANGCRLVTEVVEGARSASLGVFVAAGSRHETAELAGSSHFLEHLLFKGTDRLDAFSIAEQLDRVGGQSNAYTAREHTCFWVRLLGEDIDVGLSILGEILSDPALRPDDVAAERTVIEDEILISRDDPGSVAAERFFESIFASHPLGRDPLGTLGSVRAITPGDLRGFFDSHYGPANLVVAAAGDVDHAAVRAAVERWPARDVDRGATAAPATAGGRLELERTQTEQAQVVIGVRIPERSDPRTDALRVYDQILGGGLSSRLFTSIRERAGLAYQVYSERAQFSDAGALCIAAGTAPEHVDRVLDLVALEVNDLAQGGASDREVEIAKQALRADALIAAEDSGQTMARIGGSILLDGSVRTLERVVDGIESVTTEAVHEVAAMVGSAPRTLVVVGPRDADGFSERPLDGAGWH